MLGPEKAAGKQEGVSRECKDLAPVCCRFHTSGFKKIPSPFEVQGNQDRSYVLKRRRVVNG